MLCRENEIWFKMLTGVKSLFSCKGMVRVSLEKVRWVEWTLSNSLCTLFLCTKSPSQPQDIYRKTIGDDHSEIWNGIVDVWSSYQKIWHFIFWARRARWWWIIGLCLKPATKIPPQYLSMSPTNKPSWRRFLKTFPACLRKIFQVEFETYLILFDMQKRNCFYFEFPWNCLKLVACHIVSLKSLWDFLPAPKSHLPD